MINSVWLFGNWEKEKWECQIFVSSKYPGLYCFFKSSNNPMWASCTVVGLVLLIYLHPFCNAAAIFLSILMIIRKECFLTLCWSKMCLLGQMAEAMDHGGWGKAMASLQFVSEEIKWSQALEAKVVAQLSICIVNYNICSWTCFILHLYK